MDPDLQRALLAASGYLDLGMHQEAWDELEDLPPQTRTEDPVLEMRVAIHIRGQKWGAARILAESLARQSPDNPAWWLHWAYAVRREQPDGGIEAAREVLREASGRHADVPLIPYNLACYSCVLGELKEAKTLLLKAFGLDPELKKTALDDPDLDALFGEVRDAG